MTDTAFPDMTGRAILQVLPELSAGGVERTALEMTEAVVAAGGVSIVASKGGRLEGELAALGGELVRMDAKSKNPFTIRANAKRLEKLIRERRIDLVHARSRAPAWSAYMAAKAAGVPFVTTYHGAYGGTSALKIKYNSVMAKGAVVIANSDWIAAHVQAVHHVDSARLVTIPRGVDLDAFRADLVEAARVAAVRAAWGLAADDKRTVCLLPGRLTEWKGQLTAIDGFAQLDGPERAKLVLVLMGDAQGRESYVTKLEDRIIAQGLGGTVIIAAHCSDMPAAYLASDIVLMPSSRPEAFGRVAAEGSAMGRPVIVSDHGGARETVVEGETGARFEPGNASSLAGALRAVMALGPTGRAGMGKAGAAFVRARYSKRGLQLATLSVYARLLDTD